MKTANLSLLIFSVYIENLSIDTQSYKLEKPPKNTYTRRIH